MGVPILLQSELLGGVWWSAETEVLPYAAETGILAAPGGDARHLVLLCNISCITARCSILFKIKIFIWVEANFCTSQFI